MGRLSETFERLRSRPLLDRLAEVIAGLIVLL